MAAYVDHLVQANDIQPVVTKEDVLNTQGNLVLARGTAINIDAANILEAHPLAKPIESYIALEEEFNAEIIFGLFEQFITNDEHFQSIHLSLDISDKLTLCIKAFCQFDFLRQKLNVLAIQMPDVFDQSLFCAWMSTLILTQQNCSQAVLNNIFIASLSHDIGFLHISPKVLFKKEKLLPEEWAEMQKHAQIGKLLLEKVSAKVSDIDKSVTRAVLEHHENPDGTGYPSGKMGKQLAPFGRIINILDTVNAIYRKHFKPRNRSLRDLVPIFKMTLLLQGSRSSDTLISLMNLTAATEHCTVPNTLIASLIALVKDQAQKIMTFVEIANNFSHSVGTQNKNRKVLMLQNMARHIKSTTSSCGIINEAYMRWLEQVEQEKLTFAYRELEDVLLMAQEIIFHIDRFSRQVGLFLNDDASGELGAAVQELQQNINAIPEVAASEDLSTFLRGQSAI
ncbi:MAG: hypothetical protein ACI9Y1_000862 [Lentisphaeria bacterium]|jgi:hypothetical protein